MAGIWVQDEWAGASQQSGLKAAQFIVDAYGKAAIARAAMIGQSSDLPYPRQQIKHALVGVLRATRDPWLRESLKSAYVSLADWHDAAPSLQLTTATDRAADPSLPAPAAAATPEQRRAIRRQIAAEAATLIAELKALGI